MAALWFKNPDGDWVQSTYYTATGTSSGATSWRFAAKVFEKTGTTTWTTRWTRPTTPPPAPTVTYNTLNAAGHSANIVVTIPNTAGINRMIIKMSTKAYPAVPTSAYEPNVTYFAQNANDGTPWSQTTVVPGQVVQRPISTGLVGGTTYYFTAWVYDVNGLVSLPGKVQFKFPSVIATTPAPVQKSAYINVVDSASWMGDDNYWRTDNNYVYQAGRDSYGQWYYSTAIQAALAKATKILDVNVAVGRVNSSHGVAGEANVRLSYHHFASQPNFNVEGSMVTGTLVGTLARGEQQWFDVPSAWWAGLKSGSIRGFGLRYGSSTFTDSDYMIAYGKGTYSGRVYLKWEE